MYESLTFTSLGELIKEKRIALELSISEVSRRTGISKGIISKIESGETKRPELRNIRLLADVLHISYDSIIELYIELDNRIDILDSFLSECVNINVPNFPLITKVAFKILESPRNDSCESLERLYKLANALTNDEVRIILYNTIIKYSRVHGLSLFIARGLYQKYLVESKDLKNLKESFKVGEETLNYSDFISQEERVNFYYQMALHAHNIEKYEKCIKLGNMGHAEDTTSNEVKERIALAILNSFSRMGNFTELESYLEMYIALGYRLIIGKVKYFHAIILSKTGQFYQAIPLLKNCVEEATKDNRLHRVNDLLEVLLRINDLDTAEQILEQEEINTRVKIFSPYKYSELGKYFRFKGIFLVSRGLFNDGMEAYLQSMNFYSEINARHNIMECSEDIYIYHCEQSKLMELPLLNKLKEVYNIVNKGDKKGV